MKLQTAKRFSLSEAIEKFINSRGDRFTGRYHAKLELQLVPIEMDEDAPSDFFLCCPKVRVPKIRGTKVRDNDRVTQLRMDHIALVGTSGWNWRDKVSEWFGYDFDHTDGHSDGLSEAELAEVCQAAERLPYVEIRKSKSGKGRHFFVRLLNPVPAATRREHSRWAQAILEKMSADAGFPFADKKDVGGGILWIWSNNAAPDGFEIVKAGEPLAEVPDLATEEADNSDGEFDSVALDKDHDALVLWLTKRGCGDWDAENQRLNTHTHALKLAHKELELAGEFETIANGKKGPSDRNCFAYPRPKGAWFVCRHNPGANEHESWRLSPNGWTSCDFNKKPEAKGGSEDDEKIIATAERQDELFSSDDGRSYATFTDNGHSYTLLVQEEDYADFLRRRFRASYKRPVESKHLKNPVHYIRAVAKAGPKYKVKVRVAGHEGAIYIDLCNKKGQAVEVTAGGWHVVDNPPVRFRRTRLMAPLPEPKEGTIDALRRFCHVTDEDWPLIVGWLVAALRPEGPYTVLSMEGRPGSAKSTMARVCKALVDPSTAELTAEPNNVEDVMLQAFKSWAVAYDNLSKLDQRLSDTLCLLCTGGSYSRRKLYTTEDQTTFSVKNPVVISSVKGVITARDLVDRSLLITLPRFEEGEKRLSEREFDVDFAKAYPAIFGALLDGVASALKNLPTVQVKHTARMADFAEWVTAAEPGWGFKPNTIMEAYQAMRLRAAKLVIDTPLGLALVELAKQNWKGTAKQLAEKLGQGRWPSDPKELSGEVRLLTPDLEKVGVSVREGNLHGRTGWYLSAANYACYDNSPDDNDDGVLTAEANRELPYRCPIWLGCARVRPYAPLVGQVASFAPFLAEVGVKVGVDSGVISFTSVPTP